MKALRAATFLVLLLGLAAASGTGRTLRAFSTNVGPRTYLPGVHVVLAYANPPSSDVTIYKVPLERVVGMDDYGSGQGWSFATLTKVEEVRFGRPGRDDVASVDAGVLPVGYYAAAVGAGQYRPRWLFSVTSFGLSTTTFGDTTVAWPVDLRTLNTFKQRLTLTVVSPGVSRPLGLDADGMAIDRGPQQPHSVLIAAAADGSVQVARRYWYGGRRTLSAYIETDRPIYRPGQTVDFHAIVRTGAIGAYVAPQGPLRVTVTSARDQRMLYDRLLAVSRYGTLSGSFRLPQDAVVGSYSVSVGGDAEDGYFSVLAYKKPEATLRLSQDRAWAIAGDDVTIHAAADYLFGRPAAGMRLHYFVSFLGSGILYYRALAHNPYEWMKSSSDTAQNGEIAEGDAIADGAGKFDLTFRMPQVNEAGEVAATVQATDASGRTIVARLGTIVHTAGFDVSVTPERWFVAATTRARLRIQTRQGDADVRPNQSIAVSMTRVSWNAKRKAYDDLDTQERDVVTDAAGNATLDWTPAVEGTYRIVAHGEDERSRTATATTYLTAVGAIGAGESPLADQRVQLVPEKQVLAAGERARVLVLLPVADRDVEVAVSTDRLQSVHVLHVSGNSTVLDEPAPRDSSLFAVGVTLPTADGGTADSTTLSVDPPPRQLAIRIVPDKPRYVPGETARMRIAVADARGRPVRSEVAIGVADEGIFALRSDDRRPFETFYNRVEPSYGEGDWDLTTRLPIRTLRTIAHVSARAEIYPTTQTSSASSVRTNFLDTAFWAPSVVTDARGRATVAFRWPDNLTTWRATGVGVTMRTDVGISKATAIVTKDFLVRLAAPRFLRVGDSATIQGIAHGMPSNPNVTMRLDAGSLAAGEVARRVRLDAGSTAVAAWPIAPERIGTASLTLYGTDGTGNDAVREDVPIEGATPEEHVVTAGQGSASVRVSIPPGYGPGPIVVALSPSIIGEMLRSLRLLQAYPYDCTEQTLSAALPALFVERLLRRVHATSLYDLNAESIALKAFDRLQELRHRDGSYGWWENDAAHPFMTAYALYGLAEFHREGWPSYMDPTVDSLVEQLQTTNDDTLRFWGGRQPGSEWNTRAFMLFALGDAAPERVDRSMLSQANAHAKGMNSYAVAVLGLTDHELGDDAAAHDMLALLNQRAVDNGAIVYWPGQTWDYAWEDDPVETTAYVLRLEVALDPANERIPRIVSFLHAQMRNGWAYTTKDTAAALYALSEALPPVSGEMQPAEAVRVSIDGRMVRTIAVKNPVLEAADADVVIPAEDVRDGSIVDIERTGRGALYWSADVTRYVPPTARSAIDKDAPLLERLFPPKPDVSIVRRYVTQKPGPWRIGEPVVVELTVDSRRDLEYVSIEDPFPAGVEHAVEQGSAGAYDWSGLQFLDDRATFFATRMKAGKPLTLRYQLFPTTAGTFTAPAPTVSSMYGPPIKALGTAETVMVIPAEALR